MSKTAIPYGEESWSPVTGCGNSCPWCWSRALAHRFKRSFAPTFHADALAKPLHWRKPRRVLVCFNGDLFDPAFTADEIAAVFGVMAACPQHTFLVLTKRAERMAEWFALMGPREYPGNHLNPSWFGCHVAASEACQDYVPAPGADDRWPLPNVWLGVSVTNQADAGARIPHLLACPAAVRWLSVEPFLGRIDLHPWLYFKHIECLGCTPDGALCSGHDVGTRLDWVAAGFQSGPHAPPGDLDNARELRDDCAAAGVPFAFKNPTGYPPLDGVVHDATPDGK